MKQCTKCKKSLSLDNFYKNKSTKDGYHHWCKNCRSKNYKKNNDRYYATKKKTRDSYRKKAIDICGGPICIRCGRTEPFSCLQINHKNYDGSIRRRNGEGRADTFWRKIVLGKIPADDLEVTCEACNWVHHVENKYGGSYEVKFIKKGK